MENYNENNQNNQEEQSVNDLGAPIGFDETPPEDCDIFPFECDEPSDGEDDGEDLLTAYKGVVTEIKALEAEIQTLKAEKENAAVESDEEINRAAAHPKVKERVIAEYLKALKSVPPVMGESGKPVASPVYTPKTLKDAKRLVDSMLE